MKNKLTYTHICTHKKTERVDFRIEHPLKNAVKEMCEEKSLSVSEATRLLWLNYLSKKKVVEGFIKPQEHVYGVTWEL